MLTTKIYTHNDKNGRRYVALKKVEGSFGGPSDRAVIRVPNIYDAVVSFVPEQAANWNFFSTRSTFIHCLKAVARRMLASRCAVIGGDTLMHRARRHLDDIVLFGK